MQIVLISFRWCWNGNCCTTAYRCIVKRIRPGNSWIPVKRIMEWNGHHFCTSSIAFESNSEFCALSSLRPQNNNNRRNNNNCFCSYSVSQILEITLVCVLVLKTSFLYSRFNYQQPTVPVDLTSLFSQSQRSRASIAHTVLFWLQRFH